MNAMPPNALPRSMRALAPTGPDEALPDLSAMLSTLWRGKWRVLFFALFTGVLGGTWATQIATPIFQATAVVVLQSQPETPINLDGIFPGLTGGSSVVNTETEVLRSRSLMADVIETMNLTSDPEFNLALEPPGVLATYWDQLRGSWPGMSGPVPAATETLRTRAALNSTIEELSQHVSVRNIPDSLVFEIIVTSVSAEKAALLANTLTERYLRRQVAAKHDATEQATGWLSERVTEMKAELEQVESKANSFTAEMELVSPAAFASLTQRLKEVRERITSLEGTEQRGGDQAAPARDRLNALRGLEVELSNKIARQSDDLIKVEQLQREVAASRLIYESFLARLKETSVQQGIQLADSQILSNAMVPDLPAAPQVRLVILMTLAMGGFLGAVHVLTREARASTFRTARDIEAATGYAVWGQIPKMPGLRKKSALEYLVRKPSSAMAEAIRNLRTSLLMREAENPPQVIMVTSTLPGEGKTTQTLALAINLAGLGKRVLVIEGDIRRQAFRDYFDAPKSTGLKWVLSREKTLADAIWRHEGLGLDLLIGYNSKVNAADLFASIPFRNLLTEARKEYDIILIDTPPVLAVPDARVIASLCDAVVYAVLWDTTPRSQVIQGLDALETIGAPATGVVISQIDRRRMRRYGHEAGFGTYDAKGYHEN